jgi:TPP-dependent pyruvate/acetoin dehydrogenase alpha subunit
MKSIRVGGSVYEDDQTYRFVYEDENTDGWDHIQYLREHMVSRYPLMKIMTSDEL